MIADAVPVPGYFSVGLEGFTQIFGKIVCFAPIQQTGCEARARKGVLP